MNDTALAPIHRELGARLALVAGRELPRNYGNTAAEYRAVRESAGLVDRGDRILLRASGRDPVRMIQGLVSNDVEGAAEGQGVYATLLTPKGKMIADPRVFRRADGEVWLDVAADALEATLAHFRKFVPPLFARFEDSSATHGIVGVYGPRAREIVASVLGVELPEGLAEDAFVLGESDGSEVLAARTEYAGEDGYDLFAPAEALAGLWTALADAGAQPIGHATLEVLRIEAGRPRWGAELTEDVIPIEAGLIERAISQTKGCYTGQEVIIRILHRGRVNWHLRGLAFGDVPIPSGDATLVREGETKTVGRVTSACYSPMHGETIGLGYVRREVEPPAELRLAEADGPAVSVYELPIPVRA